MSLELFNQVSEVLTLKEKLAHLDFSLLELFGPQSYLTVGGDYSGPMLSPDLNCKLAEFSPLLLPLFKTPSKLAYVPGMGSTGSLQSTLPFPQLLGTNCVPASETLSLPVAQVAGVAVACVLQPILNRLHLALEAINLAPYSVNLPVHCGELLFFVGMFTLKLAHQLTVLLRLIDSYFQRVVQPFSFSLG